MQFCLCITWYCIETKFYWNDSASEHYVVSLDTETFSFSSLCVCCRAKFSFLRLFVICLNNFFGFTTVANSLPTQITACNIFIHSCEIAINDTPLSFSQCACLGWCVSGEHTQNNGSEKKQTRTNMFSNSENYRYLLWWNTNEYNVEKKHGCLRSYHSIDTRIDLQNETGT